MANSSPERSPAAINTIATEMRDSSERELSEARKRRHLPEWVKKSAQTAIAAIIVGIGSEIARRHGIDPYDSLNAVPSGFPVYVAGQTVRNFLHYRKSLDHAPANDTLNELTDVAE